MAPPRPTGLKDKTISIGELKQKNAASQAARAAEKSRTPSNDQTQTGR
ncbi:hypothetical protein ACIRFF_15650 [Streptomyces cyaneofuscatus]